MKDKGENLVENVEKKVRRIKRAKRDRNTILAQTVYLGTLGLVFILPVVAGAYLGLWLDDRKLGFSTSWTMTFIVIGVFVGAVNVYLLLRER